MRILVADHDPISRTMLRHLLRARGHDVTLAGDGELALTLLCRGSFDTLFAEWTLPGLSLPALCHRLRDKQTECFTQLVVTGAGLTPAQKLEGIALGIDAVLEKPYTLADVFRCLDYGERMLSLNVHEATLFAMARMAESRDAETGEHLDRVRCYTRMLAQDLAAHSVPAAGIDAEFVRMVTLTSPLHDIGKVAIPDHVLCKPGKLTDDEYRIMQTHTTIGAETLASAIARFPRAQFLRTAREIALTHHERWDGEGYPYQLTGDSIPLSGRIVAVADVYDALSSKRVYKEAIPHREACEMIRAAAGTHFDPQVIAAFLRIESKLGEFLRIDAHSPLRPARHTLNARKRTGNA